MFIDIIYNVIVYTSLHCIMYYRLKGEDMNPPQEGAEKVWRRLQTGSGAQFSGSRSVTVNAADILVKKKYILECVFAVYRLISIVRQKY